MDANLYQHLASRTMTNTTTQDQRLNNAALGLCGEAGEVADLVKKHQHHEHSLDTIKLAEELGDLLWYVAQACVALEMDMGAVMHANIEKLKRRYPDGFSSEASRNREQ